jgi:hypothetical protein
MQLTPSSKGRTGRRPRGLPISGTPAALPAGEAAGLPWYNQERLSNQAFQVSRERREEALRVSVVGK